MQWKHVYKKNTWKIGNFRLAIFFFFIKICVRRLFLKDLKSLHYFFLTRFWWGGKTSIKKTLGKFSNILPYLILFGLFAIFCFLHQKRVRRHLKKIKKLALFFFKRFWCGGNMYKKKTKLGMPYWKLFGLKIFFRYTSKACKTSF